MSGARAESHDLLACATAYASSAAVSVFPLLDATYTPSDDVFPGLQFECRQCGCRRSPRQFLDEHDRRAAQQVLDEAHQRASDRDRGHEFTVSILQSLALQRLDGLIAEILRSHTAGEVVT